MSYQRPLLVIFFTCCQFLCWSQQRYTNASLPPAERAKDLISRLTVDEKIALLEYNSPGVPRLNIPAYNWWNEALHGVARAGRATVFPQAIAMAATFNEGLIQKVGEAIADEARAKFNTAVRNNNRAQYLGLTFWSPNINIFRDPRWGRGHETYGEDPFLTGTIGSAFVKGLQGSDPLHYKTVACAKHFAVHSGPEPLRHEFDAVVSGNDLYNTYLPAFRQLVTEAKVGGLMCAYNRTDSLPCCTSPFLLQDILRQQWKFDGYVVTDCWALDDIVTYHKFLPSLEEAAALAIKAGVNVECGNTWKHLKGALQKGLVTEKEIDASLARNLIILFKIGLLDPPAKDPYSKIGEDVINSPAHRMLAKQTAAQSIVLLSNRNNTLPLSKTIKHVLVTGPNADAPEILMANYNGNTANNTTILEGITGAVSAATIISSNKGCALTDTSKTDIYWRIDDVDAVVAVLGLSPYLEGENGDAYLSEAGGDKKDIRFPYTQLKYLRQLKARTKKPIIVVLTAGSAIELEEVEQIADAVILAWYPGEEGGNAVADVLFGNSNPSGRLPVTFYKKNEDLPAFDDYAMQGRTYRYTTLPVQHPFGFGLSYTSFDYSPATVSAEKNTYRISLSIKNTGKRSGDEVVQLYISRKDRSNKEPLKNLKKIQRVSLAAGAAQKITFVIEKKDLEYWDEDKKDYTIYPGAYDVQLGASSEDIRQRAAIIIKN